eukprot:1657056-Amphidinium_carterae.1
MSSLQRCIISMGAQASIMKERLGPCCDEQRRMCVPGVASDIVATHLLDEIYCHSATTPLT